MPKIPRSEPQVDYHPSPLPNLVGDGWTAPGKAMQQLGHGLEKVGASLDVFANQQEKEHLYEAQLEALKLKNEQDLDDIKTESEYQGDGKTYDAERGDVWNQRLQNYMDRYAGAGPKVRQFTNMFAARATGQVMERAARFGRTYWQSHQFSEAAAAIGGQSRDLTSPEAQAQFRDDPAALEAALDSKIEQMNRIINDFPAKDQRLDQLRQHAGNELKRVFQLYPQTLKPSYIDRKIYELDQGARYGVPSIPTPGAAPGAVPGPQGAIDGPDYRGQAQAPASMRFNNPGAMYPGPSAQRFGSIGTETIGGGHKIAVFPNAVAGAAAQFDLLNRTYADKPLGEVVEKWAGGNDTKGYLDVIQRETGLKPDTVITRDMLRDPKTAVPLAKAMAMQEGGKGYPLSDAQWMAAHQRANAASTAPAGPIKVGVGMFAPRDTPGVVTALASNERTTNANGYGDVLSGQITVNGRTYDWVSGGRGRGSIPTGTFQVQRYTSGGQRASEGRSFTRDAFELNAAQDDMGRAAKEAKRDGLLIHDARGGVTAGCIGIKGDFAQFKQDLAAEQAKNGGRVAVQIGTQRQVDQARPPAGEEMPRRAFIDTTRAYTKTEIDNIIEKHGDSAVIGGDPRVPGYKEAEAYAREKGAKVHRYSMGPGEPEFTGQNADGVIRTTDHEDIKKRGIAVADWQGGKWLEEGRKELLAAKETGEAPYSIEWDNLGDKKPGELRDLLADQSRWAKENSVGTKIALKNLSARHWQEINKGIEAGKIDRSILAPYAFATGRMADGDAKAAEAEASRGRVTQLRSDGDAAPPDGFSLRRETNHIPASGPGQPGQPHVRPSVSSYLAKELDELRPALRRQFAASVVQEVQKVEQDAVEGLLPTAARLDHLRGMVAELGDPKVAAMLENARITGEINRQYKAAPPSVLENEIKRLNFRATYEGVQASRTGGRGGAAAEAAGLQAEAEGLDPVGAVTRRRIEALTKLHGHMLDELKRDPFKWAEKVGVILPAQVITSENYGPAILQDRALKSEQIANHYGEQFRQVFAPQEVEALKTRFATTQDRRQMKADMGMLVEAFGGRSVKALAELDKGGAVASAALGQMVLNGQSNKTMDDLADAIVEQNRAKAEGQKFESRAPSDQTGNFFIYETIGNSMGASPDALRRIKHVADLLYHSRTAGLSVSNSKSNDDVQHKAVYAQAIREAAGENVASDGKTYGGFAAKPGLRPEWMGGGGINGGPLLPPNVRNDGGLKDILTVMKQEDFIRPIPGAGDPEAMAASDQTLVGVPRLYNGEPAKMSMLRNAHFVTIGKGRYWVSQNDPYGSDPQWLVNTSGDGNEDNRFVFDIGANEEKWKKRAPNAFRGY